jgi:hypothetical protein
VAATVQGVQPNIQGTNGPSHAVTLPTTPLTNDLILVIMDFNGVPTLTSTPGDYSKPIDAANGSATCKLVVLWKRAAGGETGFTVTTGTDERSVNHVYVIRAAHTTSAPEFATPVDEGGSSAPNPPAITPTWGSGEETLFLIATGNNNGGRTVGTYPTNYATNGIDDQAGTNNQGAMLATSYRSATGVTTEDPDAFSTAGGGANYLSTTIAVRPAAGTTTLNLDRFTAWDVRGRLDLNRFSAWRVREQLDLDRFTAWRTREARELDRFTAWAVNGLVDLDRHTAWNVNELLTLDRHTAWGVGGLLDIDRFTAWTVRERLDADRFTAWNVSALLDLDRHTAWNVHALLDLDRFTAWGVGGQVNIDRFTSWNVREQLNLDRFTSWLVRERLDADRHTAWNVRERLNLDRFTAWGVGGQLDIDRYTAWTVREAREFDRFTAWITREGREFDRYTAWTVRALREFDRFTAWRILQELVLDRHTAWSVNGLLVLDRYTAWNLLPEGIPPPDLAGLVLEENEGVLVVRDPSSLISTAGDMGLVIVTANDKDSTLEVEQ